jgi:hypothetical protein
MPSIARRRARVGTSRHAKGIRPRRMTDGPAGSARAAGRGDVAWSFLAVSLRITGTRARQPFDFQSGSAGSARCRACGLLAVSVGDDSGRCLATSRSVTPVVVSCRFVSFVALSAADFARFRRGTRRSARPVVVSCRFVSFPGASEGGDSHQRRGTPRFTEPFRMTARDGRGLAVSSAQR